MFRFSKKGTNELTKNDHVAYCNLESGFNEKKSYIKMIAFQKTSF